MSDSIVLDKCRDLDALLRTKYDAKGGSLGQLAKSVEKKLPIAALLLIRLLTTIRNRKIKDRQNFPFPLEIRYPMIDLDFFEKIHSEIINIIGDSYTNVPTSQAQNLEVGKNEREPSFLIINKHCSKAIDVPWNLDSDSVVEYEVHKGINQKWLLKSVGDGYFILISAFSGRCLSVKDSSQDDWGSICQQEYTGEYNQHWKISELDDGSYSIHARHSQKALDAANLDIKDLVNPIQWTPHEGALQRWWIKLSI